MREALVLLLRIGNRRRVLVRRYGTGRVRVVLKSGSMIDTFEPLVTVPAGWFNRYPFAFAVPQPDIRIPG